RLAVILDLGLVDLEVDALDDAGEALERFREAVGAAVLILESIGHFGGIGAAVAQVGNAVLIVVGIGTAVVVLEAVLVLRLRRALVDVVHQPVAIGVLDRAAVRSHAGDVGAAVVGIEEAVVVTVAWLHLARAQHRESAEEQLEMVGD